MENWKTVIILIRGDWEESEPQKQFDEIRDSKDLKKYGHKGWHLVKFNSISAVSAGCLWVMATICKNGR